MTQLSDLSLKGMQKNNFDAAMLLILPATLLMGMLATLDAGWIMYLLGQLMGALFFMQAFILLHEFGHRSMFKDNRLNTILGHFFSFLVFIPYDNWLLIHDLHHKWAGYRDKDPTTEDTFSEGLSEQQQKIVNAAWKYYLPVFTLGYRFGTYWKTERLKKHLANEDYEKCVIMMVLYSFFYLMLLVAAPLFVLSILPAVVLSWVLCDIITLSQHAHIQMQHSEGEEVKPLKYADQMIYSRSLEFHPLISKYLLFNFNFHELHHAYPGLPCYFLDQFQIKTQNSYAFVPWLKKVKSMDGVDFIFRTSANREGF